MWRYVRKRLILLIPVLLGAILIINFILSLCPGDPGSIILGAGALRVSAQEFRREVEAAQVEIARILQQNNRRLPSAQVEKAMMDAWKKKHQKG